MHMFSRKYTQLTLAVLLCLGMVLGVGAFTSQAAPSKAETIVDHQALEYVVAERRISVQAKISDPQGVQLARCCFRGGAAEDFAFVEMVKTDGDKFVATLPAPSRGAASLEYSLLVVNSKSAVANTGVFMTPLKSDKSAPSWQEVASQSKLTVYSEQAQAPKSLGGFDDNLALVAAQPNQRYGAVAGLTGGSPEQTLAGGASNAGAAQIAQGGGIMNNTTLLVAGGVVLVGAGVAVAAGGGGGGGGGSTSSTPSCSCSGSVTVSKTNITLTVKQNNASEQDNADRIHLFVNGEIVIHNEGTNHSGTSVSVKLNACPSQNKVSVKALNRADVAGNTGVLEISDVVSGNKSWSYNLEPGDEMEVTICTQ